MSSNMYEILEKCLLEIEQGADVDTVLFRYPEFADELRPVLEASVKARSMAVPEPSSDFVRRNRAKILQHAAEMREANARPSSRIWSVPLRRFAVTLAVITVLFVSSTGLVRAASNTIPGDNLYPVKRTWEDVLLLFTFDPQERELLEFEHENERLEELKELFTEGRSVKVDFAGYVTRRSATELRVSGITVMVSAQTDLPDQPLAVGDAVRVVGHTQNENTVLAERIELLPAGMKLPEVKDDESEQEMENHDSETSQQEDNSNSGSGNESVETESPEGEAENDSPDVEETKTPMVESEIRNESFTGMLESVNDKLWVVSGRQLDVSGAEIRGIPVIGAMVKVEGYIQSNGIFVAKKVEITEGSNTGSGTNDNTNDNNNSNDDNEENDNDNKNDNNNND